MLFALGALYALGWIAVLTLSLVGRSTGGPPRSTWSCLVEATAWPIGAVVLAFYALFM